MQIFLKPFVKLEVRSRDVGYSRHGTGGNFESFHDVSRVRVQRRRRVTASVAQRTNIQDWLAWRYSVTAVAGQ